jgi:hypothetical protein
MRVGGPVPLGLAALIATGCYSSRFVRGTDVATARGPYDDGIAVNLQGGAPVRLDPSSMVRVRRRDGSTSRWFAARNILISDDGVLVSFGRDPISSVRRAWVSGMRPEDAELLEALVPPGADLKRHGQQLELVPPSQGLLPWLRAFVAARPGSDSEAAPEEWQLSTRGLVVGLRGADLAGAVANGVQRVDGLRWEDVSSLEVRNFDGLSTFLTVVTAPLWLAGIVLVGRLGSGPFISGAFDDWSDNPSNRTPGGAVVPDQLIDQGNVLATGVERGPDAASARHVFTPAASRRAMWRPVVWVGAGSQLADGRSASLTGGLAARIWDVIEVGGGITAWWPDFDGPGELRPGAPLLPGPPRWVPYLALLGRVGGDFAIDPDRRVSLPLLIELASAGEPLLQLRFRFGVRIRLFGGTFAAIHPYNPHYTEQRLPELRSWTFPSSIELGSAF